ncbi:MAG TPA: hypothetical protein VF316_21540 [Polyangiaceae bacterium]
MRLPAFLALASVPLLVLAAACVDGATPDCSKPNSGCLVVPTDAATTDAADAAEASDASSGDATDATDAATDAKADGGDAGDAKTD